ncbi:MAG: alkaline phosphatase family protein [Candidatus Eisenbacteria bacterium]
MTKNGTTNHGRDFLGRFLAALAAGILAGMFAGLFFASESLIRNPGIQGFRDRAMVLLFFPLFYGIVGAGAGAAAGVLFLLVPRAVRRRFGGSAGVFGAAVTAALFAFLEGLARCYDCHQWYRKSIPSMTVTVPESFIRFLTVAGVALLFGLFFGLALLAVRRWAGEDPSGRRGRLARGGALALVVALVAAGVLTEGPSFRAPAYDPSLASSTGVPVRLIVMDGADWDYIRPVLEAGRMPNLKALMDRGVWGNLGISFPTVSPYMWTSISTGLDDDESGLCDFFGYRPPGSNALITRFPGIGNSKRFVFQKLVPKLARRGIGKAVYASSAQKRAPEMWDYIGAAGLDVCVVGWRYSWPATPVRGVMITERFGTADLGWPIAYPPEMKDRLRRDFREEAEPLVRRIIGDEWADAKPKELGIYRKRIENLRYQMERDVKYASLGRALIDSLQPRFAAVGLTAVDALEHAYIVEHVFGKTKDRPTLNEYFRRFTTEEGVTRLSRTIEDAHSDWDSLIGVVVGSAKGEVVIIISDHGHDLDGTGHRFGPEGIIVMGGGPVEEGGAFEDPSVFDIAPTVLHLCGLPVPEGLKGRVLTEVMGGAWLAANPVRYLRAGEGPGAVLRRGEALPELRDEELEDLKALGYVD